MKTLNEVNTSRKTSQTVSKKNRPASSIRNFETKKSTQNARLETLRRKTVRNLKQGKI